MAARRGGRGQRQQQHVPGFRPGKEPPELRKQQVKQRLPKDASWSQKKMVDALGDRSPQEIQGLVKRWQNILLIVAIAIGVLALPLYGWSIIVGIILHLFTAGLLFLWYRMKKQQEQIAALPGVGGPPRGGKGRGKRRRQ